jgi:hypothetical protein
MAPVMSAVVSAMLSSMADTWTPLGTLPSGARAYALLLRNCAFGLRVLGLHIPAQLLHNSPFGRSLSSLRALAKSLPVSGPILQTFRSAASARLKSPGRFEAARSAPDWQPIPSLRSVIPQAASRARFALDSAPHQSRLGTLLPLSLAGARSCFCRDQLSQRWGASFTLRRLGAAYHGSPALWGPAQTSRSRERKFLPVSSVSMRSRRFARLRSCKQRSGKRGWAASARPFKITTITRPTINRNSIGLNARPKHADKELMNIYATH